MQEVRVRAGRRGLQEESRSARTPIRFHRAGSAGGPHLHSFSLKTGRCLRLRMQCRRAASANLSPSARVSSQSYRSSARSCWAPRPRSRHPPRPRRLHFPARPRCCWCACSSSPCCSSGWAFFGCRCSFRPVFSAAPVSAARVTSLQTPCVRLLLCFCCPAFVGRLLQGFSSAAGTIKQTAVTFKSEGVSVSCFDSCSTVFFHL